MKGTPPRQRRGLPAQRCSHKAKGTGERCRQWARAGTNPPTCVVHGLNGAMADKAEVSIVLAQVGRHFPGRPIGDVMLSAVASADRLHLEEQRRYAALDEPTDDDRDRLAQAAARANTLAYATVRAGVDAAIVAEMRRSVEEGSRDVVTTLGLVLNAILANVGVADQTERALRLWVHDAVGSILRARADGVDVPAIQPPPVQLAVVTVDDDQEPGANHAGEQARSSPAPRSTPTTTASSSDVQHDDAGHLEDEPETVDAELIEPGPWQSHGRWR